MKTQPLAAAAALVPAELTVLITCNGASNQVAGSEIKGIKGVVIGFLKDIGAQGNWNIQVRTNGNALKRKNLVPGSVKITGKMNAQQTTASMTTPEGQKRDLIIVGPLHADEVIMRSGKFNNRTYVHQEPEDPRDDVIVNLPVAIEQDNVVLFLYTIAQEGDTVLTKSASQLANGLGGEDLIDHCLEKGLLRKDGSAAYTVTPAGTATLPPIIDQTPQTNLPGNIADVIAQVAEAKRTLEERKEVEARILALKQVRDGHVQERTESEQRLASLQRQAETLTRAIEDRRKKILDAEAEMRDRAEELNSQKFSDAARVVEDTRALVEMLQ